MSRECSKARIQPVLGFPRNRFDLLIDRRVPLPERRPDRGTMAIAPRRLNEHAAQVRVARLGDRSAVGPRPTGIFATPPRRCSPSACRGRANRVKSPTSLTIVTAETSATPRSAWSASMTARICTGAVWIASVRARSSRASRAVT